MKGLLVFVLLSISCSLSVQRVEVSLEIESCSPFIQRVTKTQKESMLLDSVISSCHRQFLRLGKDVEFNRLRGKSGQSDIVLPSWMDVMGGSYGLTAATIEQDRAIETYVRWTQTAADLIARHSYPLSLKEKIPSRNIDESQIDRMEYFKEVTVEMDLGIRDKERRHDIERIELLINSILFERQEFYFRAHCK